MAKLVDILSVFWTLLTIGINLATALTAKSDCSAVRSEYRDFGHNVNDVPENAISGNGLRICNSAYSCCTDKMEAKLSEEAAEKFQGKIYEKTAPLRDFFIRRTGKFDDYMKELIAISQQDLNEMFLTTYGTIYRDNDELFMDLFSSLRSYYYGLDVDLEQVMDDFFFILFQKMFELLNNKYQYTNEFWMCTGQYMEELEPFGNVPMKLTTQLKRSVIAARTFIQGLAIGRDVVLRVSKVLPSESCQDALMRMSYCSTCNGLFNVSPCYSFCQNVMRGCLSSLAELNTDWNKYVDAMYNLAERLEGPFNVQAVLTNIDLEISNAIMTMQESAISINQKVMDGCGPLQQKPSRMKRARSRQPGHGNNNRGTGAMSLSINLERLLKDVRNNLKEWSHFWTSLSYQICDDGFAAAISEEANCWNGNSVDRYAHDLVGHGISDQFENPEVTVDTAKPNFVVRKEIAQLRSITHQLKNAFEGKDADWIDSEDTFNPSGSGSGSGSSGDGPDDDDIGYTVVDPKYRETVKTPSGDGTITVGLWSLLIVLLLASIVLRH